MPIEDALHIYSSMQRDKVKFTPLQAKKVSMYVCGVTVYDHCHVGHARMMVVFDLVYRWFKHVGYDVTYVRNFTDIDDKIIQRAQERGISHQTLTKEMIASFYKDMDALNCLRPTHEPRATQHMSAMIKMIKTLMDKDLAYQTSSGDVVYRVRKFADYGKLSGKKIDDLQSGKRVDVNDSKDDPLDFVLWKQSKANEPAWGSPWGKGRPGWHIECSAMSCEHLGKTFDIHGGGMDLKFPHHENEIAQAEGAHGQTFARYWIHNGFVNVNQEKMSKSLDNFFCISSVYEQFQPEVLRMFILSTHYRSPLDFSDQALQTAKEALDRLYATRERIESMFNAEHVDLPKNCTTAMNDDFNSPQALAVLFELARDINKALDQKLEVNQQVQQFRVLSQLLGIVQLAAQAWFQSTDVDTTLIESLLTQRQQARTDKDFQKADDIRTQLEGMGIEILDGAKGSRWRKMSSL